MSLAGCTVGVDTGGTFTDVAVLLADGHAVFNKAPTTPGDFSRGVLDALGEVAKSLETSVEDLLRATTTLKHGTTVGTNALITRTGARVGFLTTRGAEDTPLIMRAVGRVDGLSEEERKHMAWVRKPEALVEKRAIRGVHERIDHAGHVVVPIDEVEVREALRGLVEDEKVEALAVSLLFAWVNPAHEQVVKRLVEELYGDRELHTTYSHELVPVVREYARGNSVIVNAFLGDTMDRYLGLLGERLQQSGFDGQLMIMQANGGLGGLGEVSPLGTISSGPAGGVIGSAFTASVLGHSNVITTDMGGTSFDVALITDGDWHYQRDPLAGRFRVIQPMIDVESIGAGGGTIAHIDDVTGRLLLGPESAGANPGPACYGTGGTRPTVTDADLILGYISADYFWGGRRQLHLDLAEQALWEQVAEPLGLDVIEAAAGVYEIISHQMSNLIRKQVARAGYAPDKFVVYAFGGAGPVHCAAYAAQLGIARVYVFPSSPVFSAFGIATSDVIHSRSSSFYTPLPADPDGLNRHLDGVRSSLFATMRRDGIEPANVEFRTTFYMRYRRQLNELGVRVPEGPYDAAATAAIADLFEVRYEEVYGAGSGYRQAGIELVSVNVDAVAPTPKPTLPSEPSSAADPDRGAYKPSRLTWSFPDADFVDTAILDLDLLRPGNRIPGPAVIEAPIGNVVIPTGASATIDPYRSVVIELGGAA